ncbi:carbohydrate-binding domain-containing protein [Gorillibacterium sp. sgz5001074]|uniref:carbohydrate-binding domain-containing protein n=1 Tax=Gorillibacterium sp. sgz5001074 TaxID=3446695 RepID=UPI003F66618C
MKNYKYMSMQIVTLVASAALLAACQSNAAPNTAIVSSQAPAAATAAAASTAANKTVSATAAGTSANVTVTYDKEDAYTDWKDSNPNYIELKDTTAALKGTGATVDKNKVTIMLPGTYVLSGKLTDGQIVVDLQDKGTVRLVLNGAELASSTGSPLVITKASKAVISLPEGTKNTLTDAKTYSSTGEDAPTAALYSKADLTINGTGSLTVNGNYKDGVVSKDDLKITGGSITVKAADDGLIGRDLLAVQNGTLTIAASGDGMKSTNDQEAGKGVIALQNGTFDIQAGNDGIQAQTALLVSDGRYTLVTGGGSAKAAQKVNDNMQPGRNAPQAKTATTATETESAKGIKGDDLTIAGGTFKIDSADDAVHGVNVKVSGGDLSIAAGDDGLHGDSSITVQAGKVNITKSYEGIESAVITFEGGETRLVTSDDGINGSTASLTSGTTAQGQASGGAKVFMKGGYLYVNSLGDGLDSNGSMTMSGGTVVVSGPTESMNGAIDYDGDFQMTGGFLVAAGSSGMAQAPSTSSTQYSLAMSFSQVQKAGTLLTVKDSKDQVVAAVAPAKPFQTVVITSPSLVKDGSYTLYTGGTATGTLTDGLYQNASVKDASKVVSFKLASSVTWLNESGVTTAPSGHGGMGGGNRMGGGMNGGRGQAPGAGGAAPQGKGI